MGRDTELAQLHGWLEKALSGARQIVFVSGEPGIGKTTLVDAFLQSLASRVPCLASEHAQSPRSIVQSPQYPTPNPQPLTPSPWLGRGQCIEHYGAGEAYLPILEALGRLGRAPDGHRLVEILSQHAPTWLVQMPALLGAPELEALQRKTHGATRERMLRELAEAMEVLTAERPVVLWLEDLHWGDGSTLDWLAFLARRSERARLLVIGTYRPVEVLTRAHPLKDVKQELQLHGQCQELALDFLSEEDVAEYLVQRFAVGAIHESPLQRVTHLIHRRTDGNPLFMVNVVNDLVAQGVLVQSDGQWKLQGSIEEYIGKVPESLQQLIEQHIARLRPETQRLLEVASVAGAEFSAAAVSAGLETEVDGIEGQCEELVRREQFLRASGTADWPDRTVAARYGFRHALYQDVLYHRLTARRRQRLHQQIGEREEQAYGERAKEVAAELAVHFERGGDYGRAIQYLHQAGENATRRSANQEAIALLTKGLELLKAQPDTTERMQQELALQIALGTPLIATKGYAAPEVGNTYARARELCQQVGETPQLFRVLYFGLWNVSFNRAEFRTTRELAEQLLILAQSGQDQSLFPPAYMALGMTLYRQGELVPAWEYLEQSVALFDSQKHRLTVFLSTAADFGVACLSYAAFVLWTLGYPDQALRRSCQAVALAQERTHPFTLAYALSSAARLHQLLHEKQAVKEQAEVVMALSSEHGFPYWSALGTIWRGWALATQGQTEEGIAQIRRGLAAYRVTGAEAGRPWYLALLAEAYEKVGQAEEGLSALTEALALVDKTGERVYEAELYRLKGELTLQQFNVQGSRFKARNGARGSGLETGSPSSQAPSLKPLVSSGVEQEAEGYFLKAIEISRKQQAKSLELRATMSLVRLRQHQAMHYGSRNTQHATRAMLAEAHKMLSEIYNWFTEGFDTKDLQEAKALLEELSH